MTATQGFIPLFMFYISRHEWDISLLTLLYSEDIDVVKFVAGITKGAECKISFEYIFSIYNRLLLNILYVINQKYGLNL